MKIATVKPNQTLPDIAIEQYGTCEAISEILMNNPDLRNDPAALAALGIDYLSDTDFWLDVPLLPGATVKIDTDSRLKRTGIIREINRDVTTFDS